MIDFFLLYEIPTRELENLIILGNELKRRGYTVEYASFYEVQKNDYLKNNKKLKKYRNHVRVLLVPSFYHNKEMLDFIYFPFGKVEKVVNLRWEQYYVNEVMDHPGAHLYLYPCESGKNAYHICWGSVSHQNMLDAGISADRLLDTGPLHMDLLRDEFREYFFSKEEILKPYGLDYKKPTILFISSFSNATDKTSTHKYLKQFFSGNYVVDYSRIELEQASYHDALCWFDRFLEKHKEVNFIYRPHPTEFMTEQIKMLERKHPNFRVISEHSVKHWILACETIVTWMSTAVIEAYFANKPCFIIRPIDFPREKDMCVYRGAKFITNLEEFMTITSVECENSLSDEYVRQCYDVRLDEPSYMRLCDELERILVNSDSFPWDKKLLRQFDRTRPFLAISNLRSILKSKTKNAAIKTMLFFQKKTKISFGKRLDGKLNVRKNNGQIYNYRIGFQEKDEVLGRIVRQQSALRRSQTDIEHCE